MITFIITIVILAVLFYLFFIFPTQWLKVERIRHNYRLGIRVLQISDVHVEKLRISPERLTRLIQREAPDYICMTGDYTQEAKYLPKVQRYAEAIASSGIPVYAVLGNHDHRLPHTALEELVRILENAGVRVLINSSAVAGGLQIVGIDDFCSRKSNVELAYENVDPSLPVLVLTHDPNLVLHMKHRYTCLMAGHFHGMQFNVPMLFPFIHKGKLAADGIIKGLHTSPSGMFYISKGLGQAGLNARFLIRSEVTMHEL